MSQAFCQSALGVHGRRIGAAGAAKRSGCYARLSECPTSGAVGERERQATLVGDDAADAPAFENLVVEETAVRDRQIVRIAHHQTVWPVEIAAGFVLEYIALRVENVATALAGTSRIQLVRAQRATDVVDGP